MEQYNLTAKEFIFLCLNAGAKKVYGIENEFKKVRKADLSTAFSDIQKELVQKHYMRMDFDGNVTMKKKLLDEIEICALCDRVVLFSSSGDTGNIKRNYYFKGDKVVSLVWKDGNYLMECVDKDDILSAITKEISKSERTNTKENVSFSVKQREVSNVFKEKDIRKYRCYSLVQVKKDEEKRVNNLLFVETNKGMLSVKSKIVGLDNVMDIENCSSIEMKTVISKMLK